jgi:hypothetical protein
MSRIALESYPSDLSRIRSLDIIHRSVLGRLVLSTTAAHVNSLRILSGQEPKERWQVDPLTGAYTEATSRNNIPSIDLREVPAVAKALKQQAEAVSKATLLLDTAVLGVKDAIVAACTKYSCEFPLSHLQQPTITTWGTPDHRINWSRPIRGKQVQDAPKIARDTALQLFTLVDTHWLLVDAEKSAKQKRTLVETLLQQLQQVMDTATAQLRG